MYKLLKIEWIFLIDLGKGFCRMQHGTFNSCKAQNTSCFEVYKRTEYRCSMCLQETKTEK